MQYLAINLFLLTNSLVAQIPDGYLFNFYYDDYLYVYRGGDLYKIDGSTETKTNGIEVWLGADGFVKGKYQNGEYLLLGTLVRYKVDKLYSASNYLTVASGWAVDYSVGDTSFWGGGRPSMNAW